MSSPLPELPLGLDLTLQNPPRRAAEIPHNDHTAEDVYLAGGPLRGRGQARLREIDDSDAEDAEDIENGEDVLGEIHLAEGEATIDEADMDAETPFDATGLKDIGNLASWTVSTYKPGCGVAELRNEDTNLFWQSDGPQPHFLRIHFTRFVKIRAIRFYVDFDLDESYTPTRITMHGGTGYHDLTMFANITLVQPKGWIDVDLSGVGGGDDGNTLRAFLIQVKIIENHQNGKDTHLRGMKIYAADEKAEKAKMENIDEVLNDFGDMFGKNLKKGFAKGSDASGRKGKQKSMFREPHWMDEPEIR